MGKTIKLLCTLTLLATTELVAQAQFEKRTSVGIDMSMSTYVSELRENSLIRATSSSTYFIENGTNNMETTTQRYHFGIKAEFLSSNRYLGILTGVRYTQIKSSIERDEWFDNGNSKFYVLYRQDGVNSEYAQVKNVRQMAEYIGIPVELRLFTMRPRFFRLYLKLGFDFNLKVADKTRLDFLNTKMNPYEDEVARAFGKPASFMSSINPGIGFKFGDDSGVNVNLEVNTPSFITSTNASTLAKSGMGIGLQLFIYYPLN